MSETSRTFPVNCPKCAKPAVATERGHHRYGIDDELGYLERFLATCNNCLSPFLLERTGEIYDIDEYDNERATWGEFQMLYPAPAKLGASVPKSIAEAHAEAEICFSARAYTACAIMCRRALEGICVHHGLKKNLKANLDELKKQGVIENRLFEWADSLRIAGNDAAHKVDVTFTREDARDVLEFTRALNEYIFTFADAFEQFNKRRGRRAIDRGTVDTPATEEPQLEKAKA